MPTVLRVDGHRFFFFSNEGREPLHIHVEKAGSYAKFWIDPVVLASSSGYNARELTVVRKLVEEKGSRLEEKWNEHFGS